MRTALIISVLLYASAAMASGSPAVVWTVGIETGLLALGCLIVIAASKPIRTKFYALIPLSFGGGIEYIFLNYPDYMINAVSINTAMVASAAVCFVAALRCLYGKRSG